MNNYLTLTNMYNTGFIPEEATAIRERQGLSSQLVSTACADLVERYLPYKGTCSPYGKQRLHRYNYQANIVNADMQNLYPIPMTNVNYNLP